MATLKRLLKPKQTWRALNSLQTLTSPLSPIGELQPRITHRHFENQIRPITPKTAHSKPVWEIPRSYAFVPALLAGLFGAGMVQVVYADAKEVDSQSSPLPESAPLGNGDMEKIAEEESRLIAELLRSKGIVSGPHPPYIVSTKGQKVSCKFPIFPTCEIPHLIANVISHLGLKAEERGAGSTMILEAWDSSIAWQLKLDHPEKKTRIQGGKAKDQDGDEGDLYILLFKPLIGSDKAEIEFIKKGNFSAKERDALVSALKIACGRLVAKRPIQRGPRGFPERTESKTDTQVPSVEKSVAALETMGVRVFGLDANREASAKNEISWENIAGYEQQKREIEDTILLALQSPEVYDDIARGTRCKYESNRPRAVLFEGPPGTGKTSCARVIANQAGAPLLYVPLEVVMSKYYGESEKLLGKVFSLANELPNGAIIFLDEVDSFAAARDQGMHEATRRMLSVLLRQIDGFEQDKRVVVIAATNRKGDLDPALISRFDSMIMFDLPDQQTRQEIVAQYAKHLKKPELIEVASVTEKMSGRDIRDVCQQAERHWASKIIRGKVSSEAQQGKLPPVQEYIETALTRQNSLLGLADRKSNASKDPAKESGELDFL